jgi:hypothetical protein
LAYLPLAILALIIIFCIAKFNLPVRYGLSLFIAAAIFIAVVVLIDQSAQITDIEVWSGSIVDWEHKEEWDEWHPPQVYTTTDSKGNVTTRVKPGYWEHHNATNRIKTSDNGWITVNRLPDGRRMDDSYPNTTEELKLYWKPGTPTASVHTYVNKIQTSYSLYRHKEIDLKQYPDLPEYPIKVYDYFYIDRVVGDFPNELEARKVLDVKNTELNKMIPDPEKPGKMRSWKQVNIIFVNVGPDKTIDYGYALQDFWEGGNKNDFIVSMSMNTDGKVNWVYPFSWSEVEILKIEVRDYIMELGTITDLVPIIEKVSDMVADKFVRKQFADYNYLSIDTSTAALVFIWIIIIIGCIFIIWGSATGQFGSTYYRGSIRRSRNNYY